MSSAFFVTAMKAVSRSVFRPYSLISSFSLITQLHNILCNNISNTLYMPQMKDFTWWENNSSLEWQELTERVSPLSF